MVKEMPAHVESTRKVCYYKYVVRTVRVLRRHALLFAHSRLRGKLRLTVVCGTDKRMQYYGHRELKVL
jgi:hypothetical protein